VQKILAVQCKDNWNVHILHILFFTAFLLMHSDIKMNWRALTDCQQKAKGIWRRLHRMTPQTRHVAYTACTTANYHTQWSWAGVIWCIRDRQTDRHDTKNISNNSLHLKLTAEANSDSIFKVEMITFSAYLVTHSTWDLTLSSSSGYVVSALMATASSRCTIMSEYLYSTR